jgi:hypothetical protein
MGQFGYYGTNAFNVVLDMNEMVKLSATTISQTTPADDINKLFGIDTAKDGDKCSKGEIEIRNNIEYIKKAEMTICDDDYNMGI